MEKNPSAAVPETDSSAAQAVGNATTTTADDVVMEMPSNEWQNARLTLEQSLDEVCVCMLQFDMMSGTGQCQQLFGGVCGEQALSSRHQTPIHALEPILPIATESTGDNKWEAQLKELEAMGFFNRELNIEILERYQGRLLRVVNYLSELTSDELLQQS